ncbi:MAG: SoxR reducing system RseC family protein [Clostridia bacterium]|nr:SoxR reducing system RseC family protein [Clostridia bacterium]
MNKYGFVKKVEGTKITINIQRDSACGENCAMCNACPGKNMLITLESDLNLSEGDKVKLETNTKYVLLSAFCVYILPIVLLIVGYALYTLYLGLILMVLSFTILLQADKKLNTKHLINISKVH